MKNKHAAIDSNVLVALVDDKDKWHAQAQALLGALKEKAINVIYFDCVLNEHDRRYGASFGKTESIHPIYSTFG